MKRRMRHGVIWMLLGCLSMMPLAYAESTGEESTGEESADSESTLQDIKTYLYNLGLNIGYETDPAKATQPNPPTNTLFSDDGTTQQLKSIAQFAIYSLFGSIPVNAFLSTDSKEDAAGEFIPFLPTDSEVKTVVPYVKPLNALANETFPNYNTLGATPLAVSDLIDQKEYQPDPVSQAVLDSLVTPDKTFCMKNDGVEWKTECDLMYQTQVMSNAVGTLPATDTYFTYDYQAPFVSELNGNTLIAPLLYTTTAAADSTQQEEGSGLLGTNQLEAARNFIRYVTGAVKPIPAVKWADYNHQLTAAYKKPASSTETSEERTAREKALESLTGYVASARIYAAKYSVANSNLYYILSKRMPQEDLENSSQAFNEFQMATRRQYDPSKDASHQWIDSINTASPATVQKEMALLLSEINTQLYLSRQQDERLLLTNTLLLINSMTTAQPSITLSSEDE